MVTLNTANSLPANNSGHKNTFSSKNYNGFLVAPQWQNIPSPASTPADCGVTRWDWESGAMSPNSKQVGFYVSQKCEKIQNLSPSDVFFQAENALKPFSAGVPPGPLWGSLRRSRRPHIVAWGWKHPSSFPSRFLPTQLKYRSRAAAVYYSSHISVAWYNFVPYNDRAK